MDDTKQRNEETTTTKKNKSETKKKNTAADTPWPRGEIFREAIAITARAKLRSYAREPGHRFHNTSAQPMERPRGGREDQFAIIINGSE